MAPGILFNKDCLTVNIQGNLTGSNQVSGSYTVLGTKGKGTRTYSQTVRDRVIKIVLSRGKEEIHQMIVRSSGTTNSVAGVTTEMCEAAFRDFPKHLKAKKYKSVMGR